ncbi:hypothetical protein, partial [Facklamia sp. P9177]|uniref:hypothetical protein n=1 Tax=Facklamia sp. P9177 TaxID=3421945 RepID=UPI003D17F1CF
MKKKSLFILTLASLSSILMMDNVYGQDVTPSDEQLIVFSTSISDDQSSERTTTIEAIQSSAENQDSEPSTETSTIVDPSNLAQSNTGTSQSFLNDTNQFIDENSRNKQTYRNNDGVVEGRTQNLYLERNIQYGRLERPLQFRFTDDFTGVKSIKIINPEILGEFGFTMPEGTSKLLEPIDKIGNLDLYPKQASLPFTFKSPKLGTASVIFHVSDGAGNIARHTYNFIFSEPESIPFDIIRRPNLDLAPGEEKTVIEGVEGIKDKNGNVIKNPADEVIEYGPAELTFDIIRRPNIDLAPG